MDQETKQKIKLVLIVFGILLLPMFFIFKRMYAIQIHDSVMQSIYIGPHNGLDDRTVIINGIKELDRAKKFAKKYSRLYLDQAQLYCKLHEYKNALAILQDYELNGSNDKELYHIKGLIFDAMGLRDSAVIYYKPFLLEIKEKSKDSLNLVHFSFLIYGKDSAFKYIPQNLKHNLSIDFKKSIMDKYDSISYREYAIEILGK